MRSKYIGFLILFLYLPWFILYAQEGSEPQQVLDLSTCQISTGEIQIMKKLTTADGSRLKPSKRNNQLVDVEVLGLSSQEGVIFINSRQVKLVYRQGDEIFKIQALAVGFKGKNGKSGAIIERYFSDPELTMLANQHVDQKISFHAVFELPKEVDAYKLLMPVKISEKTIAKLI